MELVQVATCTGRKFVQVATCTSCLYKLQLVQTLNLYTHFATPGHFLNKYIHNKEK